MARMHVFADAARACSTCCKGRPVDGRLTGGAESWDSEVAQWLRPGGEDESRRRCDELSGCEAGERGRREQDRYGGSPHDGLSGW